MTTVDASNLIESLRTALAGIQQERADFESRVVTLREAFDAREKTVAEAIEGMERAFVATPPVAEEAAEERPAEAPAGEPQRLSVSQKYVDRVRDYLKSKGDARQADIVSDLKLNSGTVSVALRRLLIEGTVEKGEKRHGSQVWAFAKVPADREAVVRPGEGVSSGRRVPVAA